jgi:KDO2-lipid IV(A) lauroyltransferase
VNLTALAWRWTPKLPAGLARAGFALAADLAAWRRGKGVRQLEANLRRVRPELDDTALRRLARQGMRHYLRYYCEAFQLAGWSEERLGNMVELADEDRVRAQFGPEPRVVLALGHMGNWDLAGAWAARELTSVITVAERLRPEEVFQDFLAMRRRIGLEVIALEAGQPVFRQVLRAFQEPVDSLAADGLAADSLAAGGPAGRRAGGRSVALLADRDLGRGGVEVTFFGEPALMAPGPAALALATGRPLHAVAMWRRGGRYVLEFSDPLAAPAGTPRAGQVQALTQAWAGYLEAAVRRHPADWHMLAKVFVADLDPVRLAQARGDV